jgi:hypothetical protein
MRELFFQFEEWTMSALVLLCVWSMLAFQGLFGTNEEIDGARIGFTIGLVCICLLGPLCILVSRYQNSVAFWLLVVLSAPLLIALPVFALWALFPAIVTILFLIIIGAYIRGFLFILLDVQSRGLLPFPEFGEDKER